MGSTISCNEIPLNKQTYAHHLHQQLHRPYAYITDEYKSTTNQAEDETYEPKLH